MILAAGGEKLLPIISVRPQFRRGFSNKKIFWFFVYNYNHLKYKVDDLYTFSKKIKSPFIIYGFSSYMIELARLCYEKNIPLQPKSVITTGESLSVQEKVYIEKRLNTEVFNFYATQELGRLAFDCKYHNLHINSEYAYIEIVDKNGNNVADGCEGRVVVTTFDNKIMPFIRYDNGDIGSINNSKCPCGRNLPQLKVIGRHNHIIELPDGKRVPFLDTIYIFQTHTKIQQYQLIQIDQKKFIIKIIFENGLLQQAKENILFDITNRLYKILHKEITVTFDEVLEIEPTHNGKKIVFKTLIKK
jgi:phenylacetate-CoA ligase